MKNLHLKTQSKKPKREAWFLIHKGDKYLNAGFKFGSKAAAAKFKSIKNALEMVKISGGQIEKMKIN